MVQPSAGAQLLVWLPAVELVDQTRPVMELLAGGEGAVLVTERAGLDGEELAPRHLVGVLGPHVLALPHVTRLVAHEVGVKTPLTLFLTPLP
jgi:hypothetical protein